MKEIQNQLGAYASATPSKRRESGGAVGEQGMAALLAAHCHESDDP